jgi:prepilin-type processing-associated H-X9-DG protein
MRDDDRYSDDYDDRPLRRSSGSGAGPVLLILGIVGGVIVLIGGGLALLLIPAVGKVREAADRAQSMNNMRIMALGFDNQMNMQGYIEPAIMSKDGKPLLSWRVSILPFVESNNLYTQFKLDEPWDSPNNKRLLDQMPRIYAHKGTTEGTSNTHYRVFVGGGAMFEYGKKTRFAAHNPDEIGISDGTSNTIEIVEAAQAVPWTKPDELTFEPNGLLPPLGVPGRRMVNIAMADGSVRTHDLKNLNPVTLKAAITASGGEVLPADW